MNGRPKTLSVTPSHQSSLSSSKSSPCRVCSGQRMGLTGPHQLLTLRKCPYTGDTHRIPWKCPRTSAISRQDKRCVCSSASKFLLSFVATEKGPPAPPPRPTFSVDGAHRHPNSDMFLQYPARASQTRGRSTAHFTKSMQIGFLYDVN